MKVKTNIVSRDREGVKVEEAEVWTVGDDGAPIEY